MQKTIDRLLIAIFLLLVLAMAFLGENWMKGRVNDQSAIYNSQLVPTIMVPGSSATNTRFDQMIAILNKNAPVHSLLRVQVAADGSLTYSGRISSNDQQPYIVIGFENNRDGYDNIKQQARWLNIAVKALQKRYHFNHFNTIGHSNGGIAWAIYMEKYFNPDQNTISTLVTIGSPFNFAERSDKNRTQLLNDLVKSRKKIPSNLDVYSMAGTETYDDDGIVPIESVLAGRFVFQNNVHSYTEITVTGDDSSHSDLPTNGQIIDLIERTILKTAPPFNNGRQASSGG